MSLVASLGSVSENFISPGMVEEYAGVSVEIPLQPLVNQSLKISVCSNKSYTSWRAEDHENSFVWLQKVARIWKGEGIANQYLIYGKHSLGANKSFNWEIVPYQTCNTTLGRIWQQFLVLWRITWGGRHLAVSQQSKQLQEYRTVFKKTYTFDAPTQEVQFVGQGPDAFCKSEVIDKQLVLEGRLVHVLYNYAPLGFGGERLHFLIVPKIHKEKFSDLSKEEYVEAAELSKKLIAYFSRSRPLQEVYLYHKTGVDAGQTVPHWHLHIVLISNTTQGFLGKLTILKNMLLGSSPLKDAELKAKVISLKTELKSLQAKND